MTKPFYGREEEFKKLNKHLKKHSAMVAITGRRRIGKSSLVQAFAKSNNIDLIEITGLYPSKTNKKTQLENFSEKINHIFGVNKDFPNWNEAFYFLSSKLKTNKKKILLLDEISWMAADNNGFLEVLKSVWDTDLKNNNILVCLCGSVSSWIKDNIINHSNFHGRLSDDFSLKELSFKDASLLLSKVSNFEKLKTLSVLGAIPKYLEELDLDESLESNLQELFFKQDGYFFKEFERYFFDSLKNRSNVYQSILIHLKDGPLNKKEISRKTGITASDEIDSYLAELAEAGFISTDSIFSFEQDKEGKTYYKISDNFTRFYLKYVLPKKSKISSGLYEKFQNLDLLPQWDTIVGLQFENMLLKNKDAIFKKINLSNSSIINAKGYIQRKRLKQKGLQIDLLIEDKHQNYYICEFKFKKIIGMEVVREVQLKIDILTTKFRKKKRTIRPILIYSGELTEELSEDSFFAKKINAESFF